MRVPLNNNNNNNNNRDLPTACVYDASRPKVKKKINNAHQHFSIHLQCEQDEGESTNIYSYMNVYFVRNVCMF